MLSASPHKRILYFARILCHDGSVRSRASGTGLFFNRTVAGRVAFLRGRTSYDIELTAQIVEQVRRFDGRCIGCGLQRDARLSRPYADAGPTARTIRGLIFSGGVVLPVVRDVFLVAADRAQVAPCKADNRYASTGRCLVQRGRGAERISTTSMYRQHFEWDNHGSVDRP